MSEGPDPGSVEGIDEAPRDGAIADGSLVPPPTEPPAEPRPMVERIGLFVIALVLAALFGGVALALITGGELFLGVMALIGSAMTLWVGGLTLIRG